MEGLKPMNDQSEMSIPDSSRRSFLQGTVLTVASATLVGSFLRASATSVGPKSNEKDLHPNKPTSLHTKLTQWKETPLSDGRECEGVVEIKDDNGNADNANFFIKWMNHSGETYTVVHRMSSTKLSPGFTCFLSGVKGGTQGDYRTDRVTAIVVDDKGIIQRNSESEVKVLVVNPYLGMQPLAAAEAYRRDRHSRGVK